jgi:prepilin-type processing-associated H-X9-DG protein
MNIWLREPERAANGKRYTNAYLKPHAQQWAGEFTEFRYDTIQHASTRPLAADSDSWTTFYFNDHRQGRHKIDRVNVLYVDGHVGQKPTLQAQLFILDPSRE